MKRINKRNVNVKKIVDLTLTDDENECKNNNNTCSSMIMKKRRKFWYRRNYSSKVKLKEKRSLRVIVELINEKTVNTTGFIICEYDS